MYIYVVVSKIFFIKKLSLPFFLGPLHITASLLLCSKKPIDITHKFSSANLIKYIKNSNISKMIFTTP